MCLCERQTFYHDVKIQHIIYGWIQDLSGQVTVINSNSSEAGIGLGGQEIELLEQVNHALNIPLGITISNVFMCHGNENISIRVII